MSTVSWLICIQRSIQVYFGHLIQRYDFISQLEVLPTMMVSIMKSFALGNVIIAGVLPCSTSALINNKLWGCVRDQGTEKSKTKQKRLEQKQKTVMKAGCRIQTQRWHRITEQSWKSFLMMMNYTNSIHTANASHPNCRCQARIQDTINTTGMAFYCKHWLVWLFTQSIF